MKLPTRIFKRTNWYVTSPFGYRYHPTTGKYSFHAGTDYGTHCEKWAQYALEDGYIFSVDKEGKSSYGKYLWVRYPRINRSLLHAHLDSINVNKGDIVNSNTLLGYTGQTGRATGVHLHLGMTEIGKSDWLDPETYEYVPENDPQKVDVQYQAYDNVAKKWLGIITNCNNKDYKGFAGIRGHSIGGIRVRLTDGSKVTIKSHIKGGGWLSDITKWDNSTKGYSGLKGKPIDKFMVKAEGNHTIRYRSHIKGGDWLAWITEFNPNDTMGYSGITGKEIDMIQMCVE